jgi:3-methyladenine DNA glycosylase AlkD
VNERRIAAPPARELATRLAQALVLLREQARPGELAGMARYGINVRQRLGVSMPALRGIARKVGPDHELALALWDSGLADARILAGMMADPARLTARQLDAWAASFDSWDVCDQVCGSAFVRSPLAWRKVELWSRRRGEFVRRAAFALLARLAVHDRDCPDQRFVGSLAWIEAVADDDRNFVRKAASWALRNIGKRNAALRRHAIGCARRLCQRNSGAARRIGGEALRELDGVARDERRPRTI